MLRAYPHLEDRDATAGGDTTAMQGGRGQPIPFTAAGTPPGEDGLAASLGLENQATELVHNTLDRYVQDNQDINFLQLVREGENQALLYTGQVNRGAWAQTFRAYHNEHYVGSKYTRPEWR